MQPQTPPAAPPARNYSATLTQSRRITPPASREEVRHLVFRTGDLSFDPQLGNLIRVMAPGQFGNRSHARLYSIMDLERSKDGTEFAICVRRCSYIDDFNGEEYKGVASNYLCDLRPDDSVEFAGPVGYPFVIPEDKTSDILMLGMGTGIAPFRTLIRQIYAGTKSSTEASAGRATLCPTEGGGPAAAVREDPPLRGIPGCVFRVVEIISTAPV
jgi:ferredoxin--NADP+ reductase